MDDCKRQCVQLSKFIRDYPDILRFAIRYFDNLPEPWLDVDQSTSQSLSIEGDIKRLKLDSANSKEEITDRQLLEAVYQYLQTSAQHFANFWKWSEFMKKFLGSDDSYVRWLACQCIGIVTGMTYRDLDKLRTLFLTSEEMSNASIQYTQVHSTGDYSLSEAMYKPISRQSKDVDLDLLEVPQQLTNVINVCGITLPLVGPSHSSKQIFEPVMNAFIRDTAIAVAAGKPICLFGSVGTGKTSIVQHIAAYTGHTAAKKFHQVQLGEEMDSKLLLGCYGCTDVPGEFLWQPGVLTKAVMRGDWILLEDIDAATSDVCSLLISLMERNSLSVPGYRDNLIPAHGFQLFFTLRTSTGIASQVRSFLDIMQNHWMTLPIVAYTRDELTTVMEHMFPSLKTVASRMLDFFAALRENKQKRKVDRLISMRDLLKWCARSAIHNFDVTSFQTSLSILYDGIEVFCANMSDETDRLYLSRSLAATLGVVETKADFYWKHVKPFVKMDRAGCVVGRVNLKIEDSERVERECSNASKKFVLTRSATCLMERIAKCLSLAEPVLLVGETGTGKTATLQLLAKHTGNTLIVINMNQQSDTSDLIGGYKPVDFKYVIGPLRDEFEQLFRDTFDNNKNAKFLQHFSTMFANKKWDLLLQLFEHTQMSAIEKYREMQIDENSADKQKLWLKMGEKLARMRLRIETNKDIAFAFIEGALVSAVQKGHWVLLDEINLASAETLQCLSSLLEVDGTISLYEKGDMEPIKRHPNFRLMAAMNPATDVGKRMIPDGIRARFTEFFVDELNNSDDLVMMIRGYLPEITLEKAEMIAKFYLFVRKEAVNSLTDGVGHKPHFSLRTLCRALVISSRNPCGNPPRSYYESFCLSFLTQLDSQSYNVVKGMIAKMITGKANGDYVTKQPIPEFEPHGSCISFEGYWIRKGDAPQKTVQNYILTKTVSNNIADLARIVSLSVYPVLIQGDTSIGKTSLISYLAAATGNVCLRINNHEHTDIQEYIGTYMAHPDTGQLVFREGVLVEAMRRGYWIILDELNLAPSDVLEALNRVLDDNRELYIAETQVTVKAHANFRLFATQNPPGFYGGRKILSRAFRNRFIELHFTEIPAAELEVILEKRCEMAPSYAKKLVAVMKDLQARRKDSAAFAGKQGFVTLRDLFRWGERYRLASQISTPGAYYDWDKHVAEEGYLVLASRVRKREEREIIIEILEKRLKRVVKPENLFTLTKNTSPVTRNILENLEAENRNLKSFSHIVWTYNLRRLLVLVEKATQFVEPVLLVGPTGVGKTSVCQYLAEKYKKRLLCVNCHQHSDSSDFLGGIRPVRYSKTDEGKDKLFEWVDGPLVEAIKGGHLFLADEISLADDSVLERLNSLLETERTLLLNEKCAGSDSLKGGELIVANKDFRFFGTMNPSGDYGKKELSPALRNRLTEIWCEVIEDPQDVIAIIDHNLKDWIKCVRGFGVASFRNKSISEAMVEFIQWFAANGNMSTGMMWNIRDILRWVEYMNISTSNERDDHGLKTALPRAYFKGGYAVFLDGLEVANSRIATCGTSLADIKSKACRSLWLQVQQYLKLVAPTSNLTSDDYLLDGNIVEIYPNITFDLRDKYANQFNFSARTSFCNAEKVIRALKIPRVAVLLEGDPGVGKTSLVEALAIRCRCQLVRINLSEQTDVSDLFGADLPVEGQPGGVFAWTDGPFLRALKNGHWILLDELNLASQSVLEGLNAVLDHRGELFIPELGKTFKIDADKTRLFGCQNPSQQGGGRKGLPQSFLNRFSRVYMEPYNEDDIFAIASSIFPEIPNLMLFNMVKFHETIARKCGRDFGMDGAPWDFNLRDLMRWAQLTRAFATEDAFWPGHYVSLIYGARLRTARDKSLVIQHYKEIFQEEAMDEDKLWVNVTPNTLFIGDAKLSRNLDGEATPATMRPMVDRSNRKYLLRGHAKYLRSMAHCVNMNWNTILVGKRCSGKTSLVELISQLCNRRLEVISANSSIDTTDFIGGFEQTDFHRHADQVAARVEAVVMATTRKFLNELASDNKCEAVSEASKLFAMWEKYTSSMRLADCQSIAGDSTMESETQLLKNRLGFLKEIAQYLTSTTGEDKYLGELICQIDKIESDICRVGSTNSAGQFEWVDSTLVKCVKEGYWLLIEDVNLCNPAVLDRLNGLLEPNGVLTIGEKGVDARGNIVTITPHKSFRLFMTMDPSRGKISRAMRNRCVEIVVDGIVRRDTIECVADVWQVNNWHTLVQDVAILEYTVLETLYNIFLHEHLTGELSITINQCLDIAFWSNQYKRYGYNTTEAFRMAAQNVYLPKGINKITKTQDENLLRRIDNHLIVLKKAIKNEQGHPKDNEASVNLIDSTMDTLGANNDLITARMPHQGYLIPFLLTASFYDDLPEDCVLYLKEHVCLKSFILNGYNAEFNFRWNNLILYAILNFYQHYATFSDVSQRHKWIESLIKKVYVDASELGEIFTLLSGNLSQILHKFLAISTREMYLLKEFRGTEWVNDLTHFPWDLREIDPQQRAVSNFDYSYANRIHALCEFHTIFSCEELLNFGKGFEESLKVPESIDASSYTVTVSQFGNSSDKSTCLSEDTYRSELLMRNYLTIVNVLIALYQKSLEVGTLRITRKEYVELVEGMFYLKNFSELANVACARKERRGNGKTKFIEFTWAYLQVAYEILTVKSVEPLLKLGKKDIAIRNMEEYTTIYEIFVKIHKTGTFSLSQYFAKVHQIIKIFSLPSFVEPNSERKNFSFMDGNRDTEQVRQEFSSCYVAQAAPHKPKTKLKSTKEDLIKAFHDEQDLSLMLKMRCSHSGRMNIPLPAFLRKYIPMFEIIFSKYWIKIENLMLRKNKFAMERFKLLCAKTESIPHFIKSVIAGKEDINEIIIVHCARIYSEYFANCLNFFDKCKLVPFTEEENRSVTSEYPCWDNDVSVTSFPSICGYMNANLYLSDGKRIPTFFKASLNERDNRKHDLQTMMTELWRNTASLTHSDSCNVAFQIENINREFCTLINAISVTLALRQIDDIVYQDPVLLDNLNALGATIDGLDAESSELHETARKNYDLFREFLKSFSTYFEKLNECEPRDKRRRNNLIGLCWALLGYAQFILFTFYDPIDPSLKEECASFCERAKRNFIKLKLLPAQLQSANAGYASKRSIDAILEGGLDDTPKSESLFPKILTERNCESKYSEIHSMINEFRVTIASPHTFNEILDGWDNSVKALNEAIAAGGAQQRGHVSEISKNVNKTKNWLKSISSFCKQLRSSTPNSHYLASFPIVSSLTLIIRGFKMMISEAIMLVAENSSKYRGKNFVDMIAPLIRYPLNDVNDLLDTAKVENLEAIFANHNFSNDDKISLTTTVCVAFLREMEYFQAVALFQECRKTKKLIAARSSDLIRSLHAAWLEKENARNEETAEKESLYSFKTRSLCENISEEDEINSTIREYFSNCDDFEDEPDENDDLVRFMGIRKKRIEIASEYDDVAFLIANNHAKYARAFATSHWYKESSTTIPVYYHSFISDSFLGKILYPLKLRHRAFATAINKHYFSTNNYTDILSLPANIVAGTLAVQDIHPEQYVYDICYDFHRDANHSQIEAIIKALKEIKYYASSYNNSQFPDHPTLKSILKKVDYMLDFEVTIPMSHFLRGFELLLQKSQEWKELNPKDYDFPLGGITKIIYDLRSLELKSWKQTLINVAHRKKNASCRWWFHIYGLCDEYLNCDEKSSEKTYRETAKAIKDFVQKSPVGEFAGRLNLLFSFHCHFASDCVSGVENSTKKNNLRNMLWNVREYYLQFCERVNKYIEAESADINKQLIDYVKITKFDDQRFWRVKEIIMSTRRTLAKFIKKYEKLLDQDCAPLFCNNAWKINLVASEETVLNVEWYVVEMLDIEYVKDSSILLPSCGNMRFGRVLKKANDLFARTLREDNYQHVVEKFSEFCLDASNTMDFVMELDVDKSMPKEKQKTSAKNILQRKKKLLSDLFKDLSEIGLSHKRGLANTRDLDNDWDLYTRQNPLNFTVACNALENFESRPFTPQELKQTPYGLDYSQKDAYLLNFWSNCETYFLHSLASQIDLDRALDKPHKQVESATIDRIKGFISHLREIIFFRKTEIHAYAKEFYVLRCFVKAVSHLDPSCNQLEKGRVKLVRKLKSLLTNIIYVLRQYIPVFRYNSSLTHEDESLDFEAPDPQKESRRFGSRFRLDGVEMYNKLMDFTHEAQTIKNQVDEIDLFANSVFADSEINTNYGNPYEYIIRDDLINLATESLIFLNNLELFLKKKSFAFALKKDLIPENPFSRSFHLLQNSIADFRHTYEIIDHLNLDLNLECEEDSPENFVSLCNLLRNISLAAQNMCKKIKEREISDDAPNKGLLKDQIDASLREHANLLHLKEVNCAFDLVLSRLKVDWNAASVHKLVSAFPLLMHYFNVAQYLMTQQILAFKMTTTLCLTLQKNFTELATKGYKISPELLDEEEGKNAPNKGGMGMADGEEGCKDVSDQIESQDELEDAKKAGNEEKDDEEKDCKEEENGVEMSDDFDGKAQKIEEDGEEEREGQEEEEEEMDKRMGETEKGADTFDQQMWGSDEEGEGEDEGNDLEEEEGGEAGDQKGCKYGAKDEKTKEGDDKEEGDNGREESDEKKKRKEINEMEEPEVAEDQIDPYHGKEGALAEPEPLDLPDDLQLDEGEANEKGDEDENPFDIDANKADKDTEMDELPADESKSAEKDKEEGDGEEGDSTGIDSDDDAMEDDEQDDAENSDDERADEGGRKDENKLGDERMEDNQEAVKNVEESEPSDEKACESAAEASVQNARASKDKVTQNDERDGEEERNLENEGETSGQDEHSRGVKKADQSQGHSANVDQGSCGDETADANSRKRNTKPGKSDGDRTLAERNEPWNKRLKTLNAEEQRETEEECEDAGLDEEGKTDNAKSDVYQHVLKPTENCAETLDAATNEQMEQQPVANMDEEEAENAREDEAIDVPVNNEEDIRPSQSLDAQKLPSKSEDPNAEAGTSEQMEIQQASDDTMEIEGEVVATETVNRGGESSFYTKLLEDSSPEESSSGNIEMKEDSVKMEVAEERVLVLKNHAKAPEQILIWNTILESTSNASHELAEQLRLILEPTLAARLKGDFRSGRRINMRKIIPYVASQFRKDKIWLRRTKPSKREYHIIFAIDDSSSMMETHSKEMALECVALISQALNIIEAGRLGVISFGEQAKVVHPLDVPFSEASGSSLISKLSFDGRQTSTSRAIETAISHFLSDTVASGGQLSRLLLLVSDGRVFTSETAEQVKRAIKRAKLIGIFIVFIVIDCPDNLSSILDIQKPVFSGNKFEFQPYLDSFPFPYYIVLRDTNKLSSVLGDALRQWFELVTDVR